MERNWICCFTGHRRIDGEAMQELSRLLDGVLDRLIADGVTVFRTGGAMGFDTLAALKVLERREHDPSLSLELCLPCRDQTHGWDARSREYYEYILTHADRVSYVQEAYTKGCMLARNRMLVDGSQFCIGYCTSERGGSAYTLDYAKKKGLRVINLARMLPNT
jgi:uncharacterized phage-like protein YoqJ